VNRGFVVEVEERILDRCCRCLLTSSLCPLQKRTERCVHPVETAGDGRLSRERVVDRDCYSTGKSWYHDQVGISLHTTVRMKEPLSRKAKPDS
jgi:hypothetical protein